MIFPGAGGPELDKMASEKVKKDIGTFITFGLLVEAGKHGKRRKNEENERKLLKKIAKNWFFPKKKRISREIV